MWHGVLVKLMQALCLGLAIRLTRVSCPSDWPAVLVNFVYLLVLFLRIGHRFGTRLARCAALPTASRVSRLGHPSGAGALCCVQDGRREGAISASTAKEPRWKPSQAARGRFGSEAGAVGHLRGDLRAPCAC